jgi:hypothetical protein
VNAKDVAKPLESGAVHGFKFQFGIDDAKVAAQLRLLADAIEGKHTFILGDGRGAYYIRVDQVHTEQTASRDDFTTSKITLTVAEMVEAP